MERRTRRPWSMLMTLCADMHLAQLQAQRVLRIARRTDDARMQAQVRHALQVQAFEVMRCGCMLAINFDAANEPLRG